MPIWQTDKQEHLLKVKSKFVPSDGCCVKGCLYTVNIEFVLYNMVVDSESFKCYDAKIQNLLKN